MCHFCLLPTLTRCTLAGCAKYWLILLAPLTLLFRPHAGNYPYKSSGYQSEPEPNYDSDYTIKYSTLDRRRTPTALNPNSYSRWVNTFRTFTGQNQLLRRWISFHPILDLTPCKDLLQSNPARASTEISRAESKTTCQATRPSRRRNPKRYCRNAWCNRMLKMFRGWVCEYHF